MNHFVTNDHQICKDAKQSVTENHFTTLTGHHSNATHIWQSLWPLGVSDVKASTLHHHRCLSVCSRLHGSWLSIVIFSYTSCTPCNGWYRMSKLLGRYQGPNTYVWDCNPGLRRIPPYFNWIAGMSIIKLKPLTAPSKIDHSKFTMHFSCADRYW